MHLSRLRQVVIDVGPDGHDEELGFWQAAVGRSLPPLTFPEYHGATLPGEGVSLLVQRLEHGSPGVHLDIYTDDVQAEVARLEALGAERVRQVHSWWVMRDPAGLPFCVIAAPPGTVTEDNAHRWD